MSWMCVGNQGSDVWLRPAKNKGFSQRPEVIRDCPKMAQ